MTDDRCDPTLLRESLERIARALKQPKSAFFAPDDAMTREAETLALATAFARIADGAVRTRCIAFVKAEAAREEHD